MLKHCTAARSVAKPNLSSSTSSSSYDGDGGNSRSSSLSNTPVKKDLNASTSFLEGLNSSYFNDFNIGGGCRSSYATTSPTVAAGPPSLAGGFSRTSSFSSLHSATDPSSSTSQQLGSRRTPIKVYAKCLRSDIEYKTLSVGKHTTSTEVIWMLLSKFKMKHRDPKLFYLTMDIGIISAAAKVSSSFARSGSVSAIVGGGSGSRGRRSGLAASCDRDDDDDSSGNGNLFTRTLVLDDEARPAELKSCHPWGECRFTLQMRKGGLVRIHDSILVQESQYKCLLISENTTVNEVISILFHCCGLERIERVDRYSIACEPIAGSSSSSSSSLVPDRDDPAAGGPPVSDVDHQQVVRLRPDDCPVAVQAAWKHPGQYRLVLCRRNPASCWSGTNLALSTAGTGGFQQSGDPSARGVVATAADHRVPTDLGNPGQLLMTTTTRQQGMMIDEAMDDSTSITGTGSTISSSDMVCSVRSSPSGASSSSSVVSSMMDSPSGSSSVSSSSSGGSSSDAAFCSNGSNDHDDDGLLQRLLLTQRRTNNSTATALEQEEAPNQLVLLARSEFARGGGGRKVISTPTATTPGLRNGGHLRQQQQQQQPQHRLHDLRLQQQQPRHFHDLDHPQVSVNDNRNQQDMVGACWSQGWDPTSKVGPATVTKVSFNLNGPVSTLPGFRGFSAFDNRTPAEAGGFPATGGHHGTSWSLHGESGLPAVAAAAGGDLHGQHHLRRPHPPRPIQFQTTTTTGRRVMPTSQNDQQEPHRPPYLGAPPRGFPLPGCYPAAAVAEDEGRMVVMVVAGPNHQRRPRVPFHDYENYFYI